MEIIFDEKSLAWSYNVNKNRFFIDVQINFLKEKLLYKGYIYLNCIYETFGVEWDPERDNVCWRKNQAFDIVYEKKDDHYVIRIN